jgi:hypothetical protein
MSFLKFETRGTSPSGKTERWVVKNSKNDANLGWIEWKSSWRKYWFCPLGGTGYDASCLGEIYVFLNEQMGKRL